MVTINKIEIENFLGQGNLTWNLDPEVNILGGKNGSGKSTILNFCFKLLNGEITSLLPFAQLFQKFTILFSNNWVIEWTPSAQIQLTISVFNEKGELASFPELIKQTKVFLINSFEQHLSKASIYDQQPKSAPLDDPTMLDLLIKDQIDLRNSQFIQAWEKFRATLDNQVENIDPFPKSVKDSQKIYESLSHFLQGYDEPFNGSFKFTRNGQEFGYEHLSMGEKQILLLLLMVSNTNQQPCIFLMDEPDLSMHIDWKEILIKELNALNPNMQIILSTHAPNVITGWHDRVQEISQLIKKKD